MDSQTLITPNIHLVIHQILVILAEAKKYIDTMDELGCYWRFIVLGICHKTLRVLEIPHFVSYMLTPCFNKIPDINSLLPWDKEWFVDALRITDYRTAHRCLKNDTNQYRPLWLKPNQTIREAINEHFAEHMDVPGAPVGTGETTDEESESEGNVPQPDFGSFNSLPASAVDQETSIGLASAMIDEYLKHHKNYRNPNEQDRPHPEEK